MVSCTGRRELEKKNQSHSPGSAEARLTIAVFTYRCYSYVSLLLLRTVSLTLFIEDDLIMLASFSTFLPIILLCTKTGS